MEINDNLIILLLGIAILILLYNMTCKKEGFFTQVVDPYAVDYVYAPSSIDNPFNVRWGDARKSVPLEDATAQHPNVSLSGALNRPACDFGY